MRSMPGCNPSAAWWEARATAVATAVMGFPVLHSAGAGVIPLGSNVQVCVLLVAAAIAGRRLDGAGS